MRITFLTLFLFPWPSFAKTPDLLIITGQPAPAEMSAFDSAMQQIMVENHISAGALALSVDGRLVLARGYGSQDDHGTRVQPNSLFRIASISKPLTATAIMKLAEERKLALDQRPFATILKDLLPARKHGLDARIDPITIQNLLDHTAGWDSAVCGNDPVFDCAVQAANKAGVQPPAASEVLIRFMLAHS